MRRNRLDADLNPDDLPGDAPGTIAVARVIDRELDSAVESLPATSAAYVPMASAVSPVHPPPNDSIRFGVGSA
ncbi:MAG: hypothetical protein ABIT38_00145, partial [Gemmatimonadaceae bacterium]